MGRSLFKATVSVHQKQFLDGANFNQAITVFVLIAGVGAAEDRFPMCCSVSAKKPTWTPNLPTTATASVESTFRSNRDKSR